MSHRALVAVAREDDRYDVHSSRGGGADDRLEAFLSAGARLPPDLVDGPPVARDVTFEGLLADHLDPLEHEALVVVEGDGEVVPHVVLPYVLATSEGLVESTPRGVALALAGRGGTPLRPAYVRGWFHGTAEVLGEAIDAGVLSRPEAFAWLDDGVRRLAGHDRSLAVVP